MARNKSISIVTRPVRGRQSTVKIQRLEQASKEPQPTKSVGLRERKKARLRAQIMETSIRLFRERGYENTRIDDIIAVLDISQPTFFRYFPSKDALICDVGRRGYDCIRKHLEDELSSNASTAERLREMYLTMAKEVEADRPLWRAVVLSGAMDPVRSPEMRRPEQVVTDLLREIIAEGQKRGEITRSFPAAHLAEFMEALYTTVVRCWVVDLKGPHSLTKRVRSAVEFFMRAAKKSSPKKGLTRPLPAPLQVLSAPADEVLRG